MRIDTLTYSNVKMQGARQREWLREHSPRHLEQCAALMLHALQQRRHSASRSVLVLGAGACTEISLSELVRASDEVVLADLDLAAMQQAQAELSSPAQRRRIRFVACDIGGGVSASLNRLIEQQSWQRLVPQGPQAVFSAAADCLDQCPVPDPPRLDGLGGGEFGVVISSLLLSQLFSYPLLDTLDHVQRMAPNFVVEQERHRRYQQAAQEFRLRVISAHLHLLQKLVDAGGMVVLLSDVRGFVFENAGGEHAAGHRRSIPLVPRELPDLVRDHFTVIEEAHWEWLTDLPEGKRLGRGYEVAGYVLALPG